MRALYNKYFKKFHIYNIPINYLLSNSAIQFIELHCFNGVRGQFDLSVLNGKLGNFMKFAIIILFWRNFRNF